MRIKKAASLVLTIALVLFPMTAFAGSYDGYERYKQDRNDPYVNVFPPEHYAGYGYESDGTFVISIAEKYWDLYSDYAAEYPPEIKFRPVKYSLVELYRAWDELQERMDEHPELVEELGITGLSPSISKNSIWIGMEDPSTNWSPNSSANCSTSIRSFLNRTAPTTTAARPFPRRKNRT